MGSIGGIVNWTLAASSIIILVFLLEIVLKGRLNKTYQCMLWGIVLIRLLIPSMPNSYLSLFNLFNVSERSNVVKQIVEPNDKTMQLAVSGMEVEEDFNAEVLGQVVLENTQEIYKESETNRGTGIAQMIYYIWIVGVLTIGAYFVYGYLRVRNKVKQLKVLEDKSVIEVLERCKKKVNLHSLSKNIKVVEADTSIIFGIVKPTIVIPVDCSKEELEAILLHELIHYKYKDNLLTYIHLIVLSLHWFNPLVWLAIKQMKVDIEYACDERVIKLGIDKKKYAETLLKMMMPSKQELGFVQGMGDTPKQAQNRILQIVNFKKRKLIGSIFSILLVSILAVGCLTDATSTEKSNIDENTTITEKSSIDESYWSGIKNIALFGVDEDGTRTDTVMVASISCDTGTSKIISIPRDTKVTLDKEQKKFLQSIDIDAPNIVKFNELLSYGGIKGINELGVHELEKLLDLKIHNYVVINLEEAKDLLDALGGIDVEVPEDMYYVDKSQDLHIDFKAGLQHLDGEQILKFVRYRRYPEGDIGRVKMTQLVAKLLIEKALTISTLEKFEEVIGYVKETLTTDISISSLPSYYNILKNLSLEDSKFYILPGAGVFEDGKSYYVVDEEERRVLVERIK